MKKLIAAVSTVFIAVALSVVAVAAPASAHTATLNGVATCNTADGSGTIVWTVTNDWPQVVTITSSDNATIPVNTTVAATSGHGDTSKTFTQHISAPAGGTSVTTTLGFEWTDGHTQSNTKDTESISRSCTVPNVKDASAVINDTPAACGAAETVTEGAISEATWGALDLTGRHWSAVATANSGHAFASANGGTLSLGNTVDTFTGNLPLDSALSASHCKLSTAVVDTTPATCQAPEIVKEGAIAFANWSDITYSTSNGQTIYTAVATATSGYEFANGHTTLALSGPVDGEVTGHPCEDFIIVAWTMPSWVNSTTPTWSQTYFTSHEESTPDLSALDSQLTEQCGVQYQVDIYYNSPTTASLIAGNHLDGPNNPPEDLIPGGWGTAYKLVQGPSCAPVATPSESDVCTDGGTITVHASTGVEYFLNNVPVDTTKGDVTFTGLQGVNTVTASALSGYLLTGYPSGGWQYNINSDCTATYNSSGVCTASDSGSQEGVKLNLVNTSSTEATFVVTSSDSNVTPSGSYTVPAHTTSVVTVGSVSDSGGTFSVSVNGGAAINVVVDSFTGCIPATPGDPTATALSCTGTTTNLGSISTDGNPNLTYTLYGSDNATLVTPVSTFPSLPGTPTIDGLAAGTYYVHVAANSGYVLSGTTVFPFEIDISPVNCVGTEQTPVVTSVAPTCVPNPETLPDNVENSKFKTALSEVQGSITIPSNPNMTFTISDGTTTTPVSAGTYIEPDGSYTVVATLTSTAVADGFTFGTSADYTRSVNDTVATFNTITFTSECGLPTLASWHSGASATPAVCTISGTASGTITVVHGSSSTDLTDESGKVTYTLVNNANSHTTNLGSSVLTVNVAPGSYTVEAVPTDPADGLVGNPNVKNEIDYPLTVAAPTGSCDGTLAFTGGTIAWAGFILAGGMLFLGIVFLLMRRRQSRTAL